MTKENNTPQEIWDAIMAAENPICIIDSRFDYDAFGSALALRKAMESKGKRVELYFSQEEKKNINTFVDQSELVSIITDKLVSEIDFSKYDLVVTVDTPGVHHVDTNVPDFQFPEDVKLVNIDHHQTNTRFGELNYVFPGVCSTCSVLYELFDKNNIEIDKEIGYFLMLGMLTDSGQFTYEVSDKDFDMAADLVRKGVDYDELIKKIKYNQTLDNAKYVGLVMSSFKMDDDLKISYLVITRAQIDELGIDEENTLDKPSDLIRTLEGIDFAFVLKQEDMVRTNYTLSLRAKIKNIDVSKIAEKFEGGGHQFAAGGILRDVDSPVEACERVKAAIIKYRDELYLD